MGSLHPYLRLIIVIPLVATLSACTPGGRGGTASPASEATNESPTGLPTEAPTEPIDSSMPADAANSELFAQQCKRAGGTVRPVCKMQKPACVRPYADARKSCANDSDCEGRCLAAQLGERVERGSPVEGTCQEDDYPCGCFARVADGKLDSVICID